MISERMHDGMRGERQQEEDGEGCKHSAKRDDAHGANDA